MTHPDELLAGYVDGTLTDTERAAVDAHLATCAICREEVELAARAGRRLAELPDEPVPLGVTAPVSSEIRRAAAARPARRWARVQWAAGLAAAAAAVIVAVLAVSLPRGEGGGGATEAARAGAMGSSTGAPGIRAALAPVVPLETSSVDYAKPGKLQALARESSGLPQSTLGPVPSPSAASDDRAVAEEATACLTRAAGGGIGENDTLARLIRARFAGRPAYLGVYLQSSGAGRPPDKVVIWVASSSDCELLSFTSNRI